MDKVQDEEVLDVIFVLEDGEIKANKAKLVQKSEYFNKMFNENSNFKENSSGIVKLPYKKIVMDKIIDYLVKGCLDCSQLSLENKVEFVDICRMMLIEDLVEIEEQLFFKPVTDVWSWNETVKMLVLSANFLDVTLKAKLDVSVKITNFLVGKFESIWKILARFKVTLSDPVIVALVSSSNTNKEFDKFKLYMRHKDTTFAGKDIPKFQLGKMPVKHLTGEVTKSGLYDEMTMLEAIVESQRHLVNTDCECCECWHGCDCGSGRTYEDEPNYDEHSDVTLVLEDGEIKSSKFLLAARSLYFSNLFKSDEFNNSNGMVKLSVKKIIMEKTLHHLFGGKLDSSGLSQEQEANLFEFLKILHISNPIDTADKNLVEKSEENKWICDVKSMVSALDFTLEDLETKILPSGLFDEKMVLKKIIQRQKEGYQELVDELERKECHCGRCRCR